MSKAQLTCERCGKAYERYTSQAATSRFCSRDCLQRWLDANVRTKHKAPWLTKLNQEPGRNAYISRSTAAKRSRIARAKKEPRKYKKLRGRHEHRIVAERVIGRSLSSDELIHHVDEDQRNNDPANLDIGITRRMHQRIHAKLRKGVRPKVLSIRKRKGQVAGMRYRFKTLPYRHQVKALKKLIFHRGGALFMEMGTG